MWDEENDIHKVSSCGDKLPASTMEEQSTVRARCVGMRSRSPASPNQPCQPFESPSPRGSQRLTLMLKRPRKRSTVYVPQRPIKQWIARYEDEQCKVVGRWWAPGNKWPWWPTGTQRHVEAAAEPVSGHLAFQKQPHPRQGLFPRLGIPAWGDPALGLDADIGMSQLRLCKPRLELDFWRGGIRLSHTLRAM